MNCPNCGQAVSPDFKVCPYCGTLISITSQETTTVCPNCGSKVKEGYLFCSECGNPLKVILRTPVTFMELLMNGLSALNLFSAPQKVEKPTDVIYEKRPPHSSVNKYLYIGIAISIVFMFLDYTTEWLSNFGITLIGFIPPLLYFIWMYRSDRFEREPLGLLVFVIGWGIVSSFIAGYLNSYIIIPLLGTPGAAFTEEPLKIIGIYWLVKNKNLGREFNDHMDGMVYGAGSAAGFAGSENFYYIYSYVVVGTTPLSEMALIRSMAALSHIVYTSLIGRVLGVAKAKRGYILPTDLLAALPAGIILHFIWNAAPFTITMFILFPLYIFIFYRNVKAAQKDEELWGYRIRAPVE